MAANRWLHLRHPVGFSDDNFERFRASCDLWRSHVEALLRNWPYVMPGTPAPRYEFFAPELSSDRLIATLPLGGEQTLGSRARIENGSSFLLRTFVPHDFKIDLEEGLTETLDKRVGAQTRWRKPAQPIELFTRDRQRYLAAFGPLSDDEL